MNFMALLRSVEDLLYEVVSWLVFYPLTLIKCVMHPIRMMRYAEAELRDKLENQFPDVLSPPLLLFLTIIIAHIISLSAIADDVLRPGLLADAQNLIVFRAVLFSTFPLLLALQSVRQTEKRLTRANMRPAFYSQCYAAVPFVLSIDLGLILAQLGPTASLIGVTLIAAGCVWYLSTITVWFRTSRGLGAVAAFVSALATILAGFILIVAAVVVVAFAN